MKRFILSIICLLATNHLQAQNSAPRFGGEVPPDVDAIYESGLSWLAEKQEGNGGWTGGQSGPGVDGICVMAFLASGEDPNFGRWANQIRKGVQKIVLSQNETTGYFPSSMYHHGFAMLALSEAYGAVDEDMLWRGAKKRGPALAKVLERAISCATTSQKKNRWKAWRYSPDARDADTSAAGAVLMGLLAARNAGMEVPDESIDGAIEYFGKNTGPDGSVAYSGGFGGMGQTMARTAIATLVASVSKQKDEKKFPAKVKHLTTRLEHRESSHPWYYRYYMAQALFQSDYEAWKKWNAQTIRQLKGMQANDGKIGDSPYSTGMSLLALALNYRFLPIYER